MSGNKIIICPGAFYNEHVEQQNIFGVVNVYPPKDGERGGQTVSSVQLIVFRFLTEDCKIKKDAIKKSFNNAFCNNPPEKNSDIEKLVDAFFEENM